MRRFFPTAIRGKERLNPMKQLVLAAALLAAAPSFAAEWSETFVPARVATHLPGSARLDVLVTGVGAEAQSAARALIAGLRGSGRTDLVMNDVALGDVARLEDAAVVKRAAHLPVQVVVLVRVFSGKTAVVTGYDRRGATMFGFSGELGAPIDTGGHATRSAGAGVDTNAVSTIAALSQQASEEYDEKQVGIAAYGHEAWGRQVIEHANPYRGVLRKEIGWEEFYRTIGRNDLADRYRGGLATRTTVTLVGAAVAVGGLVVMMAAQQPVAGLIMVAGGGLTAGIAARWNVLPTSYEDAMKLAEEYNEALRSGRVGASPSASRGPSLALAPTFNRAGPGLVLHGAF